MHVTDHQGLRRAHDDAGRLESYIEAVRVERAKRMLEQTSDTIDRIRLATGFSDPTSFRRAFRRVVGATPTEYRRRFGATTRV